MMSFTVHLKPDHVHRHHEGTNCGGDHTHPDCAEDHWDERGMPETGWPHHWEIICSGPDAGMVGLTRLTKKEVEEKKKADREYTERATKLVADRDADIMLLRKEAATNPAFAALLRHIGVER